MLLAVKISKVAALIAVGFVAVVLVSLLSGLMAIASALNEQPAIEQVEYQVIEKIETPTWDEVEVEEIIEEPKEVEQVEVKLLAPAKELVEVEVDTIALAKEAIAQPEIVEIALEGMTHAELKAIAKSEKIAKYYKMNKAQLVKAIAGINK